MSDKMRTLVRGAVYGDVVRRCKAMEKRGWKPVYPIPKYDPGVSIIGTGDSFVMVMEHKSLKRTGTKTWY